MPWQQITLPLARRFGPSVQLAGWSNVGVRSIHSGKFRSKSWHEFSPTLQSRSLRPRSTSPTRGGLVRWRGIGQAAKLCYCNKSGSYSSPSFLLFYIFCVSIYHWLLSPTSSSAWRHGRPQGSSAHLLRASFPLVNQRILPARHCPVQPRSPCYISFRLPSKVVRRVLEMHRHENGCGASASRSGRIAPVSRVWHGS